MSNRCYTQYKLEGKQENIDKLHKDLEQIAKELTSRTVCSIPIPEVVTRLNLTLPENASQRGTIEYYEDNDIDTDSAWIPCYEFIDVLCNKYDLKYFYYAEEIGCAGIWSNDINHKYWSNKYYIYDCEDGNDIYAYSDEEAIEWINSIENGKKYNVKSISEIYDLDDISIIEVDYIDK